MSVKTIDSAAFLEFLAVHPGANHEEIKTFILDHSKDVYLSWNIASIEQCLHDVDRADEFNSFTKLFLNSIYW